jgi:hypothetical protein
MTPRQAILAVALALPITSLLAPALRAESPGERIYRDGILPDGGELTARIGADVPVRGRRAACALCHRGSGLGLADSEIIVPPITGEALFSRRDPTRAELLRSLFQEVHAPTSRAAVRVPQIRPAYTNATLLRALRDGIDPAGRPLSHGMPRYDLGAAAADELLGYLRTLGRTPAPGVDADTIRFATVIAGAVDPAREQDMLAVMNAFIAEHNLEAARVLARPGFSLHYKGDLRTSLRRWTLDVWRLAGPPASWGDELGRRYAERPVFAMLGGLAAGEWRPIHLFCERTQLPCLFPATDQPAVDLPSTETLYASRGLPGEAEALAEWLVDQHQAGRVLSVFRRDEVGERLAARFAAALAARGAAAAIAWPLAADDVPTADAAAALIGDVGPTAVVAWLAAGDPAWPRLAWGRAPPVYGCGGLLGYGAPSAGAPLPAGLRISYRHARPEDAAPQIYRIRAWLESRRVRGSQEALQLDTYFAMSVTEHALTQMVDRFSRDYLIERIEQETENALNPGTYPRLSLGPGQRFASKGALIVEVAPDGGLRPLSGWIIPPAARP